MFSRFYYDPNKQIEHTSRLLATQHKPLSGKLNLSIKLNSDFDQIPNELGSKKL